MTSRPRRSSRLCLDASCISGNRVLFPPEEARRLAKVLRLGRDDQVEVTDGRGCEYLVRLEGSGGKQGTILEKRRPLRESPLHTILVQALPKSEKMEYLIQKAVELGVSEIRPVTSRRSVAVVKGSRWEKRKNRWEKIVSAAVAQSGRTVLPVIADPESWEAFLVREMKAEVKLICREGAGEDLGHWTRGKGTPSSVLIAVGPEGGWEDDEEARALRCGFRPLFLGPRTLRTETAGIAALSLLQFCCGDLANGNSKRERETV